jgi:CRISPR-associated protein Cas2
MSLRGDLTLWLSELAVNVYVGNVSAKVRDNLWERVCDNIGSGSAVLAYSTNNEQGYDFRLCNSYRQIRDFDGLKLMFSPKESKLTTYKNGTETVKEPNLKPGYSNESRRRRAKYAKNQGISPPESVIAVDVETTGLNSETDRITAIAAIKYENGENKAEFSEYIKTDHKIPKQIAEMTGITDEIIAEKGKPETEVLTEFFGFLGDLPIVAHNALFDIDFLYAAAKRSEITFEVTKYFDTIKWAKKILPNLHGYKMDIILDYYSIEKEERHTALGDCRLLIKMIDKMFGQDDDIKKPD